mgnify:CR=1 FL=1
MQHPLNSGFRDTKLYFLQVAFILVFISDYLEEGQEPETVDVER